MTHSDKDLFLQFREHKISMSQLKSRVYMRRFKIDYVTFDDMIPYMDKDWLDEEKKAKFRPIMKQILGENPSPKDLLKELLPH